MLAYVLLSPRWVFLGKYDLPTWKSLPIYVCKFMYAGSECAANLGGAGSWASAEVSPVWTGESAQHSQCSDHNHVWKQCLLSNSWTYGLWFCRQNQELERYNKIIQVEKQHLQQQNKTLVQSLEAVVQHKLAPHKQVDLKTPVDETLDILQSLIMVRWIRVYLVVVVWGGAQNLCKHSHVPCPFEQFWCVPWLWSGKGGPSETIAGSAPHAERFWHSPTPANQSGTTAAAERWLWLWGGPLNGSDASGMTTGS